MTILQDLVAEYELNVQPYEETQKEYDDETRPGTSSCPPPRRRRTDLPARGTPSPLSSAGARRPVSLIRTSLNMERRPGAEDQLKNVLGLEVEVTGGGQRRAVDSGSGHPPEHRRLPRRCLPRAAPVELRGSAPARRASGNDQTCKWNRSSSPCPQTGRPAGVQIVVDGVIESSTTSVPAAEMGNYRL